MFSPGVRCLKGTASRDFYPLISGLTKPSEPLIGMLNNFRIRIRTERLNFLNINPNHPGGCAKMHALFGIIF